MTVLRGHGLVSEGKAYDDSGDYLGPAARWGRGRCSCGDVSPWLRSTAARQRWHREHKNKRRGGAA